MLDFEDGQVCNLVASKVTQVAYTVKVPIRIYYAPWLPILIKGGSHAIFR
jgi:hypothetical protein